MMTARDVRMAIRRMRREPGFALACVVTLALGIGINTAMFSVVNGVLLRVLPYQRADRLCVIWKTIPKKSIERDWTSFPTFEDWKRGGSAFEDMAAYLRPDGSLVNWDEGEETEQVQSAKVTPNFFDVLGTRPLLGRTFSAGNGRSAENGRPSGDRGGPDRVGLSSSDTNVAVLSYAFWHQRFGGARDVIGRTLTIDNGIFQIIGVMPAEFAFPAKDSQVWSEAKDAQIWLPIISDERWTRFQKVRVADAFGVVARLKAGVPVQQAQAEMAVVARRLAQKHAETDAELGIRVMPLTDYVVAPRLRLTLWVFLGAVGLVLPIACANVAGLFVSRTFRRRKAFAIQVTLGAGRSHILGQLFAEALVLAFVAGASGFGLAALGVKALRLAAPQTLLGLDNVGLNGTVFAFTFCVSVVAAVLSSVAPAVKMSSADPQEAFREKAGSGNRHRNRFQGFLVFAECAPGNGALDRDGIAAAKRDAFAASGFGISRGSLDFDQNSAAWSEVRRR
jgi:predicted permease